ncbi:MAG: anti-sigma factor family protein, partial [Geminicoccaceae bacterium]
MICTEIYHQLDAFVDGELPAEDVRRIKQHLDDCQACRARVDELKGLTESVKRELKQERPPSDLWARIDARLPVSAENPDEITPTRWWRDKARPLAMAASVALLLATAGGATWWQLRADYSVVAAPVQDFTTYQLSGRALDVESSDPVAVRDWFQEKLVFELPPIQAGIAGFNLVGGRLCWFL